MILQCKLLQVVKHFYLFKNSEQKNVGTDVLALDILRGRDHGLNKYTQYLELCTKDRIKDWDDLAEYIDVEVSCLFVKMVIKN